MTTYGVGNKYGLDLGSLWEMFAAEPDIEGETYLTNGNYLRYTRENDTDYYDLFKRGGPIVCMDGETCEILHEYEDSFELVEEYTQERFKLSRREFEIACMC